MQAERLGELAAADPAGRRRVWVLATGALVLALAGTGLAVGISATREHAGALRLPKAVLGEPLRPLMVYQRLTVEPTRPGSGAVAIPTMGQPGRTLLLQKRPAAQLHVRYAHVRPVVGHWQIEFVAAEPAELARQSEQGKSFDAVVDGHALSLFTVEGSSDGTNFAIGAGANWLSPSEAAGLARSLTSSVTVARCSQAAIATNECI